jgi:hypothetical protein
MSKILIESTNQFTEGLFGEIFLWIFEILPILDKANIDINQLYWSITTKSYGSIFPEILDYVNNDKNIKQKIDSIINFYELKKIRPQYVLGDDFVNLNKLFFKFFKIPENLNKIADSFNLNGYLGLHFRGTDKTTDNNFNSPLTKDKFYIIIDSYIKTHHIKNIFIATDENDVFDYFVNKYKDINFKSSRSFDGNLFWRNNEDPQLNAKMAMIDMLCLSKCETVLKVSSALSSFSKIVNPLLKIYRLNGLKMCHDIPYFPDAYIPLLPLNNNYTDECNNIITEVQKHDWTIQYPVLKSTYNNFYIKPR